MAISEGLFLSLLSLDAYNRGYDPGISLNFHALGNAVLITDSERFGINNAGGTYGFYASAYDYYGNIIISYRGTDRGIDTLAGWPLGGGDPYVSQGVFAADFYKHIEEYVDNYAPDQRIILTGHSLGGGLAGFVGSIYGEKAIIYDNMPFELASIVAFAISAAGVQPNQIAVAGAIAGALGSELAGVSEVVGAIAGALQAGSASSEPGPFYDEGHPLVVPALGSESAAFQVSGEALEGLRENQQLPVEQLFSHGDLTSIERHSISLLSMLLYADDAEADGKISEAWGAVGPELWHSAFDRVVAVQAGFGGTGVAGRYEANEQLMAAVAYSALDEGYRPFGDIAIRAMFHDADTLGKVVDGVAPELRQKLTDVLVQFAGSMAKREAEWDDAEVKALVAPADQDEFGVLHLTSDRNLLSVDVSPTLWGLNETAQNSVAPMWLSELQAAAKLNAALDNGALREAFASNPAFASQHFGDRPVPGDIDRMNLVVGSGSTFSLSSPYGAVAGDRSFAAFVTPTSSAPQTVLGSATDDLIVSGGGNGGRTIDGGLGNDLIAGGHGNDDLAGGFGNDIVAGGLGDDIIRWHGGNDILSGGGGNDGFYFARGSGQSVVDGGLGTDVAYFEGASAEYLIEFLGEEPLRDGATREVLVRRVDQPSTTFHLTDVESVVFGDLSVNLRYSSVFGYALDAGTLYEIGYDLQRTAVPGFQMDNSWGAGYSSLATISVDRNGIIHASGGEFDFRGLNGSQTYGGFHAVFDPASGTFTHKYQALDGLQFSKSITAASAIAENGNFYVAYNDMKPVGTNSFRANVIVSYDDSPIIFENPREVWNITGELQRERFIDRGLWIDAADFGPDGYLYTLRNVQGYTATGFYIQKSSLDHNGSTFLEQEASYFLDVGTPDNKLQDISFTSDGVLIGIDRYRDVVRIDLDSGQLETLGRLGGFAPSTEYTSNGWAWWPVRNFDFDIVGTYAELLEALGRVENHRPFADAEGPYQTMQGQRLHVAAADGVLNGDIDADGDALIAQLVSGPKHGALSLSADGSFSYTPNARFSGTDSFVYQASDGELTSNLVTISIDVAPSATPRARAADFNGDGTSDVLLQSGGTVVEWFLKDGAYQGGHTVTTTATGFDVKGSGDFDGDGVGDMVLQQGGTVLTWLMNRDGSYKSGNTITTTATGFDVVGSGDFNGDGISDILLQSGGTVVNWLMGADGLYASGNTITTAATGFAVKAIGDFNGDGIDDIMLQNGGTVVNWLMNAAGQYQSGNTLTTTAGAFEVKGAGDFNGDGIDDVVLQSDGTVVDWLLNDSGGYASGSTLTTTATGFNVVATGDYNGDGTSDMLLYDGSTVVQWALENGAYRSGSTLATGLTGFDIH